MRKNRWLMSFALVIIAWALIVWYYLSTESYTPPSTPVSIDSLLSQNLSWNTKTGNNVAISITPSSDTQAYEWGWEYADYSEQTMKDALSLGKRVIIILERIGDPTSEALHDDITARVARIPKNTIILFADTDKEVMLDTKFAIEWPNTIIYLWSGGQEIRRKWNGIVSLQQIVSGIDGL